VHVANVTPDWVPSGVVFDCDGLLVDTEPCWTVAEAALFDRRQLPFGSAEKALLIGRSLEETSESLAATFREEGSGPAIAKELLALVAEIIENEGTAMPGARQFVDLVAQRVVAGVASNSPRLLLDVALRRGGFTHDFTVTVAADEVRQPKPAPDVYLRACQRLGIAPDEAAAFEDSVTGLRAAQAAGMRTVGIPTLPHPNFPADFTVASLTDCTLVAWVASW
jgi:HAD superfamily hydrolase (TIGR01509 family)